MTVIDLIELLERLDSQQGAGDLPVMLRTADGWMTVADAFYDEDRVVLRLERP